MPVERGFIVRFRLPADAFKTVSFAPWFPTRFRPALPPVNTEDQIYGFARIHVLVVLTCLLYRYASEVLVIGGAEGDGLVDGPDCVAVTAGLCLCVNCRSHLIASPMNVQGFCCSVRVAAGMVGNLRCSAPDFLPSSISMCSVVQVILESSRLKWVGGIASRSQGVRRCAVGVPMRSRRVSAVGLRLAQSYSEGILVPAGWRLWDGDLLRVTVGVYSPPRQVRATGTPTRYS
jgi:hypothetical protein